MVVREIRGCCYLALPVSHTTHRTLNHAPMFRQGRSISIGWFSFPPRFDAAVCINSVATFLCVCVRPLFGTHSNHGPFLYFLLSRSLSSDFCAVLWPRLTMAITRHGLTFCAVLWPRLTFCMSEPIRLPGLSQGCYLCAAALPCDSLVDTRGGSIEQRGSFAAPLRGTIDQAHSGWLTKASPNSPEMTKAGRFETYTTDIVTGRM